MKTKLLIRHLLFVLTASCILVHINGKSLAQSTWQEVYTIFQSVGTIDNVDFAATPIANAYTSIFDQPTANTYAQSKGYKRIDPGYPHRSFFFRKINNGLDVDIVLDTAEGGGVGTLTDYEKELIRQWIFYGAPESGVVIDTLLLQSYYNGLGIAPMSRPPAPDPAEGFQIHYGPIFLAPGEETEYFKKHVLTNLPDSVEITRLHTFINEQSHHFLLYKYYDMTAANNEPDGLRAVTGLTDAFPDGTNMVAAWQNSASLELPQGTAYFWESNPILNLDLHIRNYSNDSILKADVYSNIYFQPKQPQTIEMIAEIIFYEGSPVPCCFPTPCVPNCDFPCLLPTNFCIPNNGDTITFSDPIIPPLGQTWHVWWLAGHTHKFGVDYDIYLRNPGGGKGNQIYEGWYNYNYTFNQGYFEYDHPPVRYFDPDSLIITSNDGLIHEAKYKNDSIVDVGFGITTDDEMFLIFIQYTLNPWTMEVGIDEPAFKENIKIYPNPFSYETTLELPDKELTFVLYNVLGEEIKRIVNIHSRKIIIKRDNLSGGIYFYKILDGNYTLNTGKLIIY